MKDDPGPSTSPRTFSDDELMGVSGYSWLSTSNYRTKSPESVPFGQATSVWRIERGFGN